MNIVDVVILLTILMFGVVGLKNGVFKQTIQFFGALLIIVLAYSTKDILGNIFLKYLPFFKYDGLTSINIFLYQFLAFLIMLTIFGAVLQIVVNATGVIEKILKFTIILGIPSKILGFLIGLLQGVLVSFIIVLLLSQPFITVEADLVKDSKITNGIKNNTLLLSKYTEKLTNALDEVKVLKEEYTVTKDKEKFNNLTVDVLLKYNVVDADMILYLKDKNKI